MKTLRNFVAAVAVIAVGSAFVKPVKDDTFKVDTQRSSVEWVAKKVTGQHSGNIKLASGDLTFNGNALKAGSFNIDMNSINVTDLSGDMKNNLTNHLKSEDFFSVAKNAVSTFVITKVTAAGADRVNVAGNLTIKGITKPLSFPATIKRQGNTVVAVAKGIKVDRTQYDIKYRSKNFFGDIGDKAIDDEFELSINLTAKK